jgi:hypothetical protein
MATKIFRQDPEPDTTGSVIKWTLGPGYETNIYGSGTLPYLPQQYPGTVCLNKTLPKLYRPFFEKGQIRFQKAISDTEPITLKILDQTGSG